MLWLIIASIMVISIYSCYENVVDQNIKDFVSTPVIIPIDKMEHKICSLFPDTVKVGKHYRIVNYIGKKERVDCIMS